MVYFIGNVLDSLILNLVLFFILFYNCLCCCYLSLKLFLFYYFLLCNVYLLVLEIDVFDCVVRYNGVEVVSIIEIWFLDKNLILLF